MAPFYMCRCYLRSIAGYRADGPLSVRTESDDASLPYRAEGRRPAYDHRAFERWAHSAVASESVCCKPARVFSASVSTRVHRRRGG